MSTIIHKEEARLPEQPGESYSIKNKFSQD